MFTWRTFKFNPLAPPPGTDFLYWAQIVADLFFDAFFPTPAAASKNAFLNALIHLYGRFQERYGPAVYPCMSDLQEEMKTAEPDSGPDRSQACLNRLRPLLLLLHDMFDCQAGFSLEDLLNEPVVLELDGLTQEIQAFILTVLFYWIFTYRLGQTQRGTLKHILVFDEAKMVFSKEKASGAAPVARLVSTAREMGQGQVAADQMPSTLGHALLANVSVLIALSLSARKDMQDMAYAMGLHDAQREYLNHLPLGLGIV